LPGNVTTAKLKHIQNRCGNSLLFKSVSGDFIPPEEDDNTSVCELLPETAVVLADIISWARYIVPAFLIILTGIDISRIVVSGNIEEELPKRKKTIFIRLIVAAVFFFLPIIVQLLLSIVTEYDYGDISCIWK